MNQPTTISLSALLREISLRWPSYSSSIGIDLCRMIDLRLDRRVKGRVNASDILQDAYVDLAWQLKNSANNEQLPFFIWMRRITGQRLEKIHREHLGVAKRNLQSKSIVKTTPISQKISAICFLRCLSWKISSRARKTAGRELQRRRNCQTRLATTGSWGKLVAAEWESSTKQNKYRSVGASR